MKHAILIDSDERIRTQTAHYLSRRGYAVTGIQGVGQLDFVKVYPDVLLIDVQCQLHLNFISKVLKLSYDHAVPVVLMSESAELKEYLIDIPVHAILLKPFKENELSNIMD